MYIYIYIYVYEYIHVCDRVARLAASVQALSQSAVPWMAPEVLQAGVNWPWILLTKILELQGESQWPMACVSSLVIFVVWNWFFVIDDGSRSVACLFLGELLVFAARRDCFQALPAIFGPWVAWWYRDLSLIALGCGFQVSIGQLVKTRRDLKP